MKAGAALLLAALVLAGSLPSPNCAGCMFTSPGASWLYAGPRPDWGTARALDTIGWYTPSLATLDSGFGLPVQHTRGKDGFTRIDDRNYPSRRHSVRVPNPPGNRWTVSCGWKPPNTFGATSCYGAYDGKDFIIDDRDGEFYEIDQMYVDAAGHPINFGVYAHGSGPCGGRGQPTCGIRGVFRGNLATSPPNLGGGSAAGIVSGAGDILPGELDCLTCLNHAVQVVAAAQLVNRVTCDAIPIGKQGDGAAELPKGQLCEGGMLRWFGKWDTLDPATHSVAVIGLARALQLYGGAITDQGGPIQPGIFFYTGYETMPVMDGARDLLQDLAIYYGSARLH